MKKIFSFLIFSLLIFLSANAQFCNKYADKAVAQYKLAKSNKVPNTNWPLWSDDWNGHFNWCKTVTEDAANKQTAFREDYLNKYITKKKPQTKEEFCNSFADRAVVQYYRAKQLFNPEGDLWSNDRNYHYKWCMQVSKNTAKQQEGIRQAMINEYYGAAMHNKLPRNTDSKGDKKDTQTVVQIDSQNSINTDMVITMLKKNTCEHYAEESVKQNRQNISQACGLGKEPEWSNDYKKHYNWCMHGNNYKTADNTLKSRNKQLSKCSKSIASTMTIVSGRSAFGTTMATTYMDMHNMFVPHKNNCSTSEAFVPLWQGAELGFCIDKDYHSHTWGKTYWSNAIRTCLSENKRLPEPWEWQIAIDNGLINLNGIQSGEWGSNFPIPMHTNKSNGMAVPILYIGDYNIWGFVSSSDISSKSGFRGTNYFRCVH